MTAETTTRPTAETLQRAYEELCEHTTEDWQQAAERLMVDFDRLWVALGCQACANQGFPPHARDEVVQLVREAAWELLSTPPSERAPRYALQGLIMYRFRQLVYRWRETNPPGGVSGLVRHSRRTTKLHKVRRGLVETLNREPSDEEVVDEFNACRPEGEKRVTVRDLDPVTVTSYPPVADPDTGNGPLAIDVLVDQVTGGSAGGQGDLAYLEQVVGQVIQECDARWPQTAGAMARMLLGPLLVEEDPPTVLAVARELGVPRSQAYRLRDKLGQVLLEVLDDTAQAAED